MRIERVAVNASPLITLFKSGQSDLLPRLFEAVVVPEAVWQEVAAAGSDDVASLGLTRCGWPIRARVSPSPRVEIWNLGAGETAVLSRALAHPPERALVDDAAARRCAKTLGIPVLGTGGLLVLAKRRGLIASATAGLERLRAAGLWLSDDLFALLRAQAGE